LGEQAPYEATRLHIPFTLLVVDDQPTVREGLIKMIGSMKLGFTAVFESENGRAALSLIRRARPDIILTDVMMSEMDGLEMLEALREQGLQDIRVVVVSAYHEFVYAQKALALKASAYLLKPVSKAELFQTLVKIKEEICDSRRKSQVAESHEREYYGFLLHEYLVGENPLVNVKMLYEFAGFAQPDYRYLCVAAVRTQPAPGSPPTHRLDAPARTPYGSYIRCVTPGMDIYAIYLAERDEHGAERMLDGIGRLPRAGGMAGVSECAEMPPPPASAGKAGERRESADTPRDGADSFAAADLVSLYRHAMAALENGRFERVSFYDSIKMAGRGLLSLKEHRNVLRMILANDASGLEQWADQLFVQIRRRKYGKQQTIALLNGLMDYIGVHMPGLGGEPCPPALDRGALDACDSYIAIKAWLARAVREIGELSAKNGAHGPDRQLFDRILAYMHDNYSKDISLSAIADRFSINYTYLSNLFKKKLNITYSDYLTKLRMETALELLTGSRRKIYEIAEMVGYSDVKYFIRLFSSVYLISPNRYRREAGIMEQ
jgi:two-component system response regulator YesN